MFLGHFGVALGVSGPPPPSQQVLAASALAGWLFVAWGYWIERHRAIEPRATALA